MEKLEQELRIEAAQSDAAQNLVTRIRHDLINTRLAARIMAFLLAATVLSGCASSAAEFLPQSCAITNCGDVK